MCQIRRLSVFFWECITNTLTGAVNVLANTHGAHWECQHCQDGVPQIGEERGGPPAAQFWKEVTGHISQEAETKERCLQEL